MPREIVSLHVGHCGMGIGYNFWQDIAKEHKIDANGHYFGKLDREVRNVGVYWDESHTGRFVPRCLNIDCDPSDIDLIQNLTYGKLFKPFSYVYGKSSCGNNYAKGFFGIGQMLAETANDRMRKLAESCDTLDGFQLTHSVGGGCGSGVGALLSIKMRDEYHQNMVMTFTVFPSPSISDIVVEPYNAILASMHLIENINQVYCFDNEVLNNIAENVMGNANINEKDLNRLINHCINDLTSSNRYSGQLNSNFRKIGTNLIAFERLHFLCTSFAPLSQTEDFVYRTLTAGDLTQQMFSPSNMQCSIDTSKGMYMAAMCIFRGENQSTKEIEDELLKIQSRNSKNFLPWVPHNICNSVVRAPHNEIPYSATLIANNTSISYIWEHLSEVFNTMFSKNAFMHWYTAVEGMEENLFTEADSNCADLVAEYETKGRFGKNDEEDTDDIPADATA